MKYSVIPQLVVPRGGWGTVEFAVKLNGRMPAKEFLESEGEDAGPVLALFKEMPKQAGQPTGTNLVKSAEPYTPSRQR